MGKTPKPLTILVHPLLLGTKEVKALIEKGHDVTVDLPDSGGHGITLADYDLVLGPTAFRMTPEMMKYLDLAIKSARAVKYPKPAKEKADVPRRKRRTDAVAPVETEAGDVEPTGDGHRGSADGAAGAGDP